MTFTSLGRSPAQYDAYPPWNSGVIVVVEQAIREAWRTMLRDHQDVLATRDEDRISDRLLDILVDMRTKEAV
ncbi:hypothetical protein LG954_10430, partial [Bifidobacterium longum subsp. infantis]|uniref:hypothetical protein n=1 Tax=Bifidobacterium longum TaxID=216816 RepID=UPI001CFF6FF6